MYFIQIWELWGDLDPSWPLAALALSGAIPFFQSMRGSKCRAARRWTMTCFAFSGAKPAAIFSMPCWRLIQRCDQISQRAWSILGFLSLLLGEYWTGDKVSIWFSWPLPFAGNRCQADQSPHTTPKWTVETETQPLHTSTTALRKRQGRC